MLYRGAEILILDEPTAVLTPQEVDELFEILGSLKDQGKTIIFITHNEIHSRLIADRYTFLALGKIIGAGTKKELVGEDIRRLMAGGAEISDLEQELSAI